MPRLSIEEDFFFKGFLNYKVSNKTYLTDIKESIKESWLSKDRYKYWIKGYSSASDLKNIDYKLKDKLFSLFDPRLTSQFISDMTGHEYFYGGILVRMLHSGRSYFGGWHRDYYKYGKAKTIGPFPPTIKLIYTPRIFNENNPKQFKFAVSSNIRYSNNSIIDTKFLPIFLKKYTHKINDNYALIFNGFGLHTPVRNMSREASLRIIINFHPIYNREKFLSFVKGKKTILMPDI